MQPRTPRKLPRSSAHGRTAVIFAAHPWEGIPYGLHHISRALGRLGWQILYVEPYFSLLHLVGGRRRGRIFGRNARPTQDKGVAVLSPFTPLPHVNLPILRSPWTLRMADRLSWPRLGAAGYSGTNFA